jgi:ribonuclease HI
MKILSWNCRGLSRASAIRSLRGKIRTHSPDVLFLSETKLQPSHASVILNSLGFFMMSHAPPSGSKGGLLLAWRHGVDLACVSSSVNTITAWCYSDPPNNPWLLTCIYGPPVQKDKSLFWDSLLDDYKDYCGPWMCIGDFNMIISQSEKYGGRPFACSSNDAFHSFLDSFGMIDLGFSGNPYTWSNKRRDHHLIKERLDRGVANSLWVHLFPHFSVQHLPAQSSDHNPILLDTAPTDLTLPRPFRFEEFWTFDPSCGSTILSAWNNCFRGSPPFILSKKLKSTKSALKHWNYNHFGNIQKRIAYSLSQLDHIQQSPPSASSFDQEILLQHSLDNLLIQEESLWRNKSRETWLTCKDLNTKFFHTSTIIKRRRNAIDFLKLPSGVWSNERQEIGNCFTSHFRNVFTSSGPLLDEDLLSLFDNCISSEENTSICEIPTEQEIFSALTEIGSTKAPGPDGFTALFYKKYWHIVKDAVLSSIWNFFRSNHLIKEQNHTFIALIPKKMGASSVHQFRPISLCNIIYKIISKILANRFKGLLHHFISPFQSAFVPSRNIQDNSILVHELFNSINSKRGRGGLMAVKIDMEKAFDRMEWSFILAILSKLGFHSIWINWIRICITSPSFSILINGSPFGLFNPERGLRQGDPLSPFLFILGSEVLSRLLIRQESQDLLKGIKIARNCSPISHLLFADDLILFAKATSSEANILKSILDKYCYWSGQAINSMKSSIHFSKNTTTAVINSISSILPYKRTSSSSKYLGLPLFIGKSKAGAFKDILDKVSGKIEGWRAKMLSQAGRTVLIKTVASSIPSYAMSSFLMPISFSSSLDRIFKNFWWGFPKDKTRNLSLKSWSSICLPKEEGGLGFRRMHEFNLALIAKLGWKLISNLDCLWVKQLQNKYIKYGDFISSPVSSSASWLWKGIQKIKPIISAGACLRVSKTSSAPIWSSNWVPTIPSFRPRPKFPFNINHPALQVRDLIDHNRDSWNAPSIHAIFDSTSAHEILKIRISMDPGVNFLWAPSTSGQFTVSSAYQFILANGSNNASTSNNSIFWKSIWKLNLNDRLKLFLWKIAWNILPTKERLSQLSITNQDSSCPLCKVADDSLNHLFFECIFARVAWRHSFWPLDSTALQFSSMSEWISSIISPGSSIGIPFEDKHKFQIFAAVACDILWFYRNKAYHDSLSFDARSVSMHINKISLEHFQAWHISSQIMDDIWTPPPCEWVKINFDTAIRDSFSAQAAVCRNDKGQILHATTKISNFCTPNEGEAMAAHLAISLANSIHMDHYIIEGDSEVVVHALQNPNNIRDWRISSSILDSLESIPSASFWEVRRVKRSANFCAHSVARWAAAGSHSGSIPMSSLPSFLFTSPSSGDPPFTCIL